MDYTNLPYLVQPMKLRDVPAVMEIEHVSFPSPWSARAYRHELLDNDLSHYFVVRQRPMEDPQLDAPFPESHSAGSSLDEASSRWEGTPRLMRAKEPAQSASQASVQRGGTGKRLRQLLSPHLGTSLFAKVHRPVVVGERSPILGYAGFWLMVDEAHISTIAVRPDWRGLGLGELLLAAMLERATGLEADRATLEVRVSNITAQNLYHKYGFRRAGLRRRYYRDNDEDALIMSTERLTSASFQGQFQQLKRALCDRLSNAVDKTP
jgi:ribosomal-protein-alanine N-acetyltransferase